MAVGAGDVGQQRDLADEVTSGQLRDRLTAAFHLDVAVEQEHELPAQSALDEQRPTGSEIELAEVPSDLVEVGTVQELQERCVADAVGAEIL